MKKYTWNIFLDHPFSSSWFLDHQNFSRHNFFSVLNNIRNLQHSGRDKASELFLNLFDQKRKTTSLRSSCGEHFENKISREFKVQKKVEEKSEESKR